MLGDFGMRQAVEESQSHALALRRRELLQALRQLASLTGAAEQVQWTGVVAGQRLAWIGPIVVILHAQAFGAWLGLRAAQAVDGAVAGDVGEPGQRLAARGIEAGRGLPDRDIDFLQQVFGHGPVALDAQHHRKQMAAGAFVQLRKGGPVAQTRARQQLPQFAALVRPGCGFKPGAWVILCHASSLQLRQWPVPSL